MIWFFAEQIFNLLLLLLEFYAQSSYNEMLMQNELQQFHPMNEQTSNNNSGKNIKKK